MGTSHGDFIKYPRTPHLFGSRGTDDDKHLGEAESTDFIADNSLIVEEKIDGTNVGIHFSDDGNLVLQCRGHLITEGMHPQYDLFKQWATVKRFALEERLGTRFILFGEWVYARHSVLYRHARIELVWIEPPFDKLLRQNGSRKDAVPEQVVRKLAAKCEPPTWKEGHKLLMIDGESL